MKARDIIPGWPRGRSTSPTASDHHLSKLNNILFFRGMGLCVPFLCSQSQYITYMNDMDNFKIELIYETTYHQMQQAMVNEFRKNPRSFYDKFVDGIIDQANPPWWVTSRIKYKINPAYQHPHVIVTFKLKGEE